jgi:hypothetical protein
MEEAMMRQPLAATVLFALTIGYPAGAAASDGGPAFPPEFVCDTTVYPDESLVNVKVVNHRWPDCDTLPSIARDIFRIEGVNGTEVEDEAKAMALWKWFRLLMSNSIPHAFEGPIDSAVRQREAHKSLTVYGHHECGGLSSVMSALWRAAGYIGYKESSSGHSTVALRYPDADGAWRFHCFDPMSGYLWWDAANRRIGVRTCPLMQATVFRVLDPIEDHTLRTSLRWGERLSRQWDGEKVVLKNTPPTFESNYFKTTVFETVAGLEVQTLEADVTPGGYARALWKDSTNTACSAPRERDGAHNRITGGAQDRAALHAAKAGTPAAFIYRLPSPYAAVEALVETRLRKGAADDRCRLAFSTDLGRTWTPCFDKQTVGAEDVEIDIGNALYLAKKPSVTSTYTFLLKAEFQAAAQPERTGMDALKITVKRQLNKRCLMNLLPGENAIRVSADRLAPGLALTLNVHYAVNGKPVSVARTIDRFPFYFRVNVEGVPDDYLKTMKLKGAAFNEPTWPLRMAAIEMRLTDATTTKADPSLSSAEVEPLFSAKCPHPYDPRQDRGGTRPTAGVGDAMALGGFFPQRPRLPARELTADERTAFDGLVQRLSGSWSNGSAEALGNYAQAVEPLIAALPRADGDKTLYICKALAQIGDRRAVPALLDKWERRRAADAPGTRYLPDALAACGDPSVVPALVKPLKTLRLDYRFHVIHALGVLGGRLARETLEDLAKNDPHYANRVLAETFLRQPAPVSPQKEVSR